jgi:FtsP/CotA-like multicopper oxidase with cupredoxin domain
VRRAGNRTTVRDDLIVDHDQQELVHMSSSSRLRSLAALGVAAVLGLSACGSSAKSAATTAAPTTTAATAATAGSETTADAADDAPATTNAAPVPATPNADGSVTIKVTVGTDDFDTSGGKRVVAIKKGAAVTIELTSKTAESYHLHGYDIETEADAGATGKLGFTADQTGQFDLESHTSGKTLLVVVVA